MEAVALGDPSRILSSATETLESHLIVFAAEHARKTRTVAEVNVGASTRTRAASEQQA